MNAQTTTYAETLIVLTPSTATDILPDTDGVDASATAEAYDNLLASILEMRFPGATVEFDSRAMVSSDDADTDEINATIAAIIDGPMMSRQAEWIITA